jgi:adenylylsulfate kinase
MSWAIWITGLPGSGKSAIARAAAERLAALGEPAAVLELDAIRRVLTPAPTYSEAERDVVYRSLVYMATALTGAGVPVIIDATAHRREWRDLARASIGDFAEVQLQCPLEVCRERERSRTSGNAPPQIYARAGRPAATVPGVDVAYEPALLPELVLDTTRADVPEAAAGVVALARRFAASAGGARTGARGWVVWITGLPGSGKTMLASGALELLRARGIPATVLDWTELRHTIVPRAWLSEMETEILHRALGYTARLLTEAGVPVLVEATAPRRSWRELARRQVVHFAEVQLLCPREVCLERERAIRWTPLPRDPAGHRRLARAGTLELVLDYEPSLHPELTIRTDVRDHWAAVEEVARLAAQLHRIATART